MPSVVCRRYRIRGVVQGVGYRYFTIMTAEKLGIGGWCANLPDGSVLVQAEGTASALDEFVSALRSGPSRSRVDGIEIDAATPTGATAFTVRSGATV